MRRPLHLVIRIFFVASSSLWILGCATRPVSNADAKNIPDARVINHQYSVSRAVADAGLVTIKRDKGIEGAACSSRISVNAEPIADIQLSEKNSTARAGR